MQNSTPKLPLTSKKANISIRWFWPFSLFERNNIKPESQSGPLLQATTRDITSLFQAPAYIMVSRPNSRQTACVPWQIYPCKSKVSRSAWPGKLCAKAQISSGIPPQTPSDPSLHLKPRRTSLVAQSGYGCNLPLSMQKLYQEALLCQFIPRCMHLPRNKQTLGGVSGIDQNQEHLRSMNSFSGATAMKSRRISSECFFYQTPQKTVVSGNSVSCRGGSGVAVRTDLHLTFSVVVGVVWKKLGKGSPILGRGFAHLETNEPTRAQLWHWLLRWIDV